MDHRIRLSLCVILSILLNVNCQEKQPPNPNQEVDIDKVFDPNDPKAGYQRKYTINVGAKAEDCFALEGVLMGQIMNFHWMVTNVDKSGRKLDISFKLKSPDDRIANFQGRKTEGSFLGHEAKHFGDYEICFNNRFSMMESKRVVFQFEVEGMEDSSLEEEKSLNATVEEFKAQSRMVKKKVMAVRSRVARMKHQQWRIQSNMKKDIDRAEAITGMIDRWSLIHMVLLVSVGVIQVLIMRRLFNAPLPKQGMKMRT